MTICDYIIELFLQTMFYATGEIGLPVHNQFAHTLGASDFSLGKVKCEVTKIGLQKLKI